MILWKMVFHFFLILGIVINLFGFGDFPLNFSKSGVLIFCLIAFPVMLRFEPKLRRFYFPCRTRVGFSKYTLLLEILPHTIDNFESLSNIALNPCVVKVINRNN
uniref:Putative ovule protein n=1 Tax=Solanum chacoense TaxID=4108 RepID=A0A0V0I569_SOLCH